MVYAIASRGKKGAMCRKVFAEMELSVKSSVDTAAFAASLQLDNSMQQVRS